MAILFLFLLVVPRSLALEPTLVLALMVRDEEANLRLNLPRWKDVADAVVCGIDDRTTDGSAHAVLDALDVDNWVFYFRFENFGQGRTLVLAEAWRKFSHCSHVLTLDPDWEPLSLAKSDLDWTHRTYFFTVRDRNGMTTRALNWLVRHEQNLTFRYRVHEELEQGTAGPDKLVSWQMHEKEIEGRTSWHKGGSSHSYERYLDDLELLYLDLRDGGGRDNHTLYFLGLTHLAALEAKLGVGEHSRTPEVDAHVNRGMRYLTDALDVIDDKTPRYASALRWLAYAHHHYTKNVTAAEHYYARCADADAARLECRTFLAALYRGLGRVKDAWPVLIPALKAHASLAKASFVPPQRNTYVNDCSLPLEAALALLDMLRLPEIKRDSNWQVLAVFGESLLSRAKEACTNEGNEYISATPLQLSEAQSSYAVLRATSPQPPSSSSCVPHADALAAAGGDAKLLDMMRAWGLDVCPTGKKKKRKEEAPKS